jgi:hypothetical protein
MIFTSQVGQMLTNLRVSTNNMLLPFTAQILALLQDTASQKEMGELAYLHPACMCPSAVCRYRLSCIAVILCRCRLFEGLMYHWQERRALRSR